MWVLRWGSSKHICIQTTCPNPNTREKERRRSTVGPKETGGYIVTVCEQVYGCVCRCRDKVAGVCLCVCVCFCISLRGGVFVLPPHLQVLRGSGFEQSGSYYRSEALLICLQTLLLASLPLSRSPFTLCLLKKKKNNSTALKNRPAQLERRLRDSIALFPQSRAVADGILWRNYFTGVSPPTGTGLSDEKRQVKNCIVWVQMGVLQCSSAHTSNPPSWTVVVVKVEVAKNGYNTSLYNKKTSLMCFHGLLAALSEQS